jgi:outer membrane protein assembly factor BamE (lipoprotein component of BamABCDE complex)
MRIEALTLIGAVVFAGCSHQQAQIANEAPNQMIGLSREQVRTCMGVPMKQAATGATEVWSYDSGNSAAGITGNSAAGVNRMHNCMMNVVMTDGRVSSVNYAGDTGGPITQGEQCAFAVRNCVR